MARSYKYMHDHHWRAVFPIPAEQGATLAMWEDDQ